MFNIGPWELALILLVALLVVGPGKLPEVAKSIGKGINEFKKVTNGYKQELQDAMNDIDSPVKSYEPSPLEKKEEVIQKETVTVPEEKKEDPILDLASSFDSEALGKKEEVVHTDDPASATDK